MGLIEYFPGQRQRDNVSKDNLLNNIRFVKRDDLLENIRFADRTQVEEVKVEESKDGEKSDKKKV